MPKILNYPLQVSLYHGLIASCTQQFLNTYSNLLSIFGKELWYVSFSAQNTQKLVKCILQNRVYSQKYSTYSSKVLKSTLYIQKSTQKQLKARRKLSCYVLFALLTVLFLAFYYKSEANYSL
jgi:hypothetical protein